LTRLVPDLVKKFPAYYGTQRFIIVCTVTCHVSPFWVRPIQSTPPTYFFKVLYNIIFPSTPKTFKWSLSFRHPLQILIYLVPHTCLIQRSFHSPWFDYPNNIWYEVQISKPSIMFLFSTSYYFPNLRPRRLLQYSVLFPQFEWPRFTPLQNRHNYNCVCVCVWGTCLTLILLTWRIGWAHNNATK